MLYIYNSVSRKKETFIPREAVKMGMYVCGITIYDYCLIGRMRVFIMFDLLCRHFFALEYKVVYVRNSTNERRCEHGRGL